MTGDTTSGCYGKPEAPLGGPETTRSPQAGNDGLPDIYTAYPTAVGVAGLEATI